ncbi:MAG: large subunit ribosomal protein L6 [Candidatus Omnitrophota bacterium]|jgi:large subunit ribosomal protein L6
MSRIGNKIIEIPANVVVKNVGGAILVEGPKGKLSQVPLSPIEVSIDKNIITVKRPNDSIPNKVKHGTTRALINNMVKGVTLGYEKKLLIEGVGFKAQVKGNSINLLLGFSHPIDLDIPTGLEVKTATPTEVTIAGIDKQLVGFFSAKIRSFYEPEPYKGKGIRYSDEVVRRKAGKSVSK